jgi:serine/threonine protein kinase
MSFTGVLIYEMVYGRTPFRGKNRQTTFTNILEKDLLFPANIPVSLEGRQLMRVLLEKDPAKRLGSLHGANDIKTHPFFYGINWPLIRNMVGSILSPPPLIYATGLFSFPLPIHAILHLHPKLFLNGTVGTPFCTKQGCIKRATFVCRVLHSEIYVSCNFSLLCGQCYSVIHNSEIGHLCCFLCEKTPPPLDVPLSIITCMPDIDHQGGELEWDELEAATTFADTF